MGILNARKFAYLHLHQEACKRVKSYSQKWNVPVSTLKPSRKNWYDWLKQEIVLTPPPSPDDEHFKQFKQLLQEIELDDKWCVCRMKLGYTAETLYIEFGIKWNPNLPREAQKLW